VIELEQHPSASGGHASDVAEGWTRAQPEDQDAAELTALLRRHEERGRGWSSGTEDGVLVEISRDEAARRRNLVLCDPAGAARGWATTFDRVAGRMLFTMVVDPRLDDSPDDSPDDLLAHRVAELLLEWGEETATTVGAERGLATQQIDSGAFAADVRQQRWLARAGFSLVRTWWQMTRPVGPGDDELPGPKPGVRIRLVEQAGSGMPDEDDLLAVHDILEEAFADHFNAHAETFVEFLARLREDPGHRWDHWWLAELLDAPEPAPVGTLVGSVTGEDTSRDSYVEYLGVLEAARGRGVAKALLNTIIGDAAERGLGEVGLEVDADSPTGADRLYLAMGWKTKYVTQSWHRDVPVTD